ncbi:MAG: AMP-binding protein [Alphaproteobacteria bacterium]|nr:AMP-binding protein [Alphaproteobacteria bacterium]
MARGLPDLTVYDTFPKLLLHHALVRGGQPAWREKDFGIWQTWNWGEVADEVRAFALGLKVLGFQRGDRLAIVGDNRPHLYWAMLAAQSLGGVPVPMYQDAVANEMRYVLSHAEVRFAVVEDQEQVDKLLEIKGDCLTLEHVIYSDPRGLRNYTQPFLTSYAKVQELGRTEHADKPAFFEESAALGKGSDLSVILYTSGTTGQSKGVMLTYSNVIMSARGGIVFEGLTEQEEVLAYLPMAWVGDHIYSFGESLVAGFCVACPESSNTVMHDLCELGPTFFFAPPRIFENLLTQVMIRMEDASRIKRAMFHYFMGVAKRSGAAILDGKPVGLVDRLLYALGRIFVYGPLLNVLGFSRIRLAHTAGEAIGPDIFRFYRSLGMNIKQIYGSTEASVFITIQPDGNIKDDTVGLPAPDVELKMAESGEVLFRSPGSFLAYFKNDEGTKATKTEDGWVHTGDAGFLDEDGQLKIIDRAKDVGKLNTGGMFAPKYIENKLKFFPFIKEAVAYGDKQDFVACFLNIDIEAVGNWAERRGLAYSGYTDLAGKDEVYQLLSDCVDKVNKDLANDPHLSDSQVKRFLVLHKELDADDGELTRTRKVRRAFIAEKYDQLVQALYSGQQHCSIEAQVTFEDGRKGTIKADLRIQDAETYQPLKKVG